MSANQPSHIVSTPQNQPPKRSDNQQASKSQVQQQDTSSIPSQGSDASMSHNGNGYGCVHQNHIYAIYKDSNLGRDYEELETWKEKREFLITKGEKRGQVVFNTRCQTPDQT